MKGLYILIQIILALRYGMENVLKEKASRAEQWKDEVGRGGGSVEELAMEVIIETTDTLVEKVQEKIAAKEEEQKQLNITETEEILAEYEAERKANEEAERWRLEKEAQADASLRATNFVAVIEGDCSDIRYTIETSDMKILNGSGWLTPEQETELQRRVNQDEYTEDDETMRVCLEESLTMYLEDSEEKIERKDDVDYEPGSDYEADTENRELRRSKRKRNAGKKDDKPGKKSKG